MLIINVFKFWRNVSTAYKMLQKGMKKGGLTTASFISFDSMLPFLRRTGSVPLCRCTNHCRR